MIRFYIFLILLTALFMLGVLMGAEKALFKTPSFWIEILLSIAIATALVFSFLANRSGQSFTQFYLLTIVAKMLVGGIFISVVLFLDKAKAVENAVLFIVCYLLFTALEVAFLFNRNKRLK